MYLRGSPVPIAQLCEFIAKPSPAWKKRLHQSGRANYRGSAEVFLPGAPTHQPNPTNHPPHPPLNPLFPGCGQLTPPFYLIQDLNHSWSFMGSQATCFFMEMECVKVIIYISNLVGNSKVGNSEISTIKISLLLMR